jgi:type IV pilus assembly protein PilP
VPHVTPVSEPKQYVPLPYTEGKAVDPFNVDRLTKVWDASPAAKQCAALLAVEFNRRKEPLEAFPLDVMSMVGSLQRNGQRVALLKVDKLLYQVRPANYLGQNYGRITQVSENEVTLREIVQDAAGECIERMTTLQLQENTK